MTRKKKIWIGVAVAVVLAAGFAVSRARKPKLPEVTTQKVDRQLLESKVSANGRIEAQRKVDLSANVMGQIVNLAVREGDQVDKGEFLLQIDQAQLAANAQGAEASVRALFSDRDAARATAAESRLAFERAEKSYRDELIPLSEVDRTRAAVTSANATVAAIDRRIEQARANLAGARDSLSKTTIVAPMAGVVTRLPVEEGEVAVIGTMNNAGTVLLTISDLSTIEAVMEVDETDIPRVAVGQKATVTVDAYEGKTFPGVVTEVGSSPMQAGDGGTNGGGLAVNFEVKIQLENPPPDIRPGFSASADILTGRREDALTVPIQALVVRDAPVPGAAGAAASAEGETTSGSAASAAEAPAPAAGGKAQEEEGVYRFDSKAGKVTFIPVETGMTGETQVEIVSGLETGDEVVTGPFRVLREIKDGDEVKKSEPPKDGEKKKD